jgi:hypothetical protein
MEQESDFRRALLNPEFDQSATVLEERRTALSFANPYGARISEYEQVLLYTQPNPDWLAGGIGVGGWAMAFPGGRGAWENYFTEAKISDWFVFRDPEARWQRPYVSEKADEWREIQRLFAITAARRNYRGIDSEWLSEVLTGHLGALGLHDYGLFMALAAPIRDCLVDTLRAAIVTTALDYLDNAQMIQAEKVFLDQVSPHARADIAPSKQLWLHDPTWAGSRNVVEEIWGSSFDHIEILFAIHVVHEPLFGRFVREEFFSKAAALHGDQFTPPILGYAARGAQAANGWILELFGRNLTRDPKFGEYNKTLLNYWAEKWLPLTLAAIADAQALWQSTEILRDLKTAARERAKTRQSIIEDWQRSFAPLFARPIDFEANAASLFGSSGARRL